MALLACSDGSGSGGPSGDGGGGGGGGGTGDTLTFTSDLYSGSFEVRGTIALARPLPAGTRVAMLLTDASRDISRKTLTSANEFENKTLSGERSTLPYVLKGLKPGKYLFGIAADTSGDGAIGEGDVGGYNGGTAEAPALYGSAAKVITVADANLEGVDFGVGAVTCKAKVGAACTKDEDCRGTTCTAPTGFKLATSNAACPPSTQKCQLSNCESVDPSAQASEGGCFGGL
jgi:hypothetical protein